MSVGRFLDKFLSLYSEVLKLRGDETCWLSPSLAHSGQVYLVSWEEHREWTNLFLHLLVGMLGGTCSARQSRTQLWECVV